MSAYSNTHVARAPLPAAANCSTVDFASSSQSGSDCGETNYSSPSTPSQASNFASMPPSFQMAYSNRQRQSHTGNRQNNRRQQQHQAPPADLPFPECVYHKTLVDKLEFIQAPPTTSAGVSQLNMACYRLFIGQVRFETTAAEMRWLIHYLTGVSAVKIEVRGMGCFMGYFASYDDIRRVCELRYRLLFDHNGVWFARQAEQAEFLQRYTSCYVSQIGRGFRLPKDMMVIEEEEFQPYVPKSRHEKDCPAPVSHFHPQQQQQRRQPAAQQRAGQSTGFQCHSQTYGYPAPIDDCSQQQECYDGTW